MADTEEEEVEVAEEKQPKKIRLRFDESKAGIIYLSKIPTYMNVKRIRHMMEQYGEVGRIFLQPDERAPPDKKNRSFSEGWIEFRDKKMAKRVALSLNNTQIGGKRRSKWYEELWNMKYLSRFKWTHLNERLAYEREVHKQRLRTEVMQAKKETNFFIQNVEKHQQLQKIEMKKKKRKKEAGEDSGSTEVGHTDKGFKYRQRDTEKEILSRKRKLKDDEGSKGKKRAKDAPGKSDGSNVVKRASENKKFLINLFSGGVTCQDPDTS